MMPNVLRVSAVLAVVMLTACAQQPVRKLYEGEDRPASEVAVVRVPVELEVMRINGRRIEGLGTLFSPQHKDLHLLPGEYRILAYYKDLWELSGDGHDVIKTDPALFVVNAEAGHTYELGFDEPENVAEARELEEQFSGYVLDRNTGDKTPTRGSGLAFKSGIAGQLGETTRKNRGSATASSSTVAPLKGTEAGANSRQETGPPANESGNTKQNTAPVQTGESGEKDSDYLGMLKAYWSQATKEERRAFLQWISEKDESSK